MELLETIFFVDEEDMSVSCTQCMFGIEYLDEKRGKYYVVTFIIAQLTHSRKYKRFCKYKETGNSWYMRFKATLVNLEVLN
jgi:hypothetical protein